MDDKQLWQDSLIEAIFEADPSGLAVIAGPDLRVVYANPSFRMICSSSPGEILGSPFKSVWPADSSQLRRRLSQVIHSGKPCIMTGYEYQFPDGAVRYFTVQIRRVAWQDQPAGLLILWDITDQQKASLQAQQERDRLAAVLQSIPDEVWICDTTGKIVQANQAAKQNIGVDEKWPVNRNVRNLLTDLEVCNLDGTPLPPEEAPLLQSLRGRSLQGEEVLRNQRTNEMRFRKVNSSPIKNTSGEILGAVAVVRDITEEKLANQRLLYQSMLLDNIHDAVIAMDANLKITLWNRSAEILSGMKAEQAIGKYFYNIVDRVGVSFLDREADRKRLDQEGILLTEYTYRAQDGRTAVLESIDIALHSESGEVIGYIVASRDVTRRKQVETALLESERKYRELVRYAPVGIYELDFRTQRFVSINDVICQLTGYSREELMEMNPLDILDDEGKNRFRNRMKQWLSGEQPEENVEYRVIAKDGHEIYAVLNVNFTADEKGNPVGATVIGYDVTERVQAKLALEAANQRINEILESIKDVFYSLDHDWRFTYVNQRAFDVWGKQSDELIGKSIWEVFPQLLETVAYQYLHQAMRDRSQVQYEHLSPVVGRWISVHVYPSADGGLTIYFQDISERKKIEAQLFDEFKKLQQTQAALQESEAQLRKSEERFQLVLKGTPITVYTMDATLRYTWAYNLRHGASPEMLLGKRDDELMSSERAAPLLAIKQSVLESGRGTRQEVDITVRGEDFVYDMSVDPIFDEHGKACGITVIAVDITDRIRLDQQIQANRVRLELQQLLIDQREHERLQIARDLHDGPIQDLTGAYYTLKSLQIGMVDETLRQAISNVAETVQSQVDELRAYMQDLRPPTLEKFGLEPAIRSHLENFQTKYSELEIAFLPQPLPYPLADTAGLALYRICQESMNNIAKHANAHRVEIHLWSDDDWVNLEIQDDGIGFDLPSDWLGMARQGHLGLVGIRERVEAINGRLAVDTQAGKGTRLLVSIPIS